MLDGENPLLIEGSASTVRFAVLLPVPVPVVWVLVRPPLVFGLTPTVLLVTTTVTVQVPPAGIVSPVKLNAVLPAVKELPEAPVQVPPAAPVAEMLMLLSVSAKAAPVSAVVALLLLFSVKVTVEVPPEVIAEGAKALSIVGSASTVRLAVLLTAPVPVVCVLVTPLLVFGLTPAVLLVTTTVTVQLPAEGMVNPVKLKAVFPAVNELPEAPVQVPAAAAVAEMLMLLSVSVNAAPVSAVAAFELLKVKVRVEVPPVVIVARLNAWAMVGNASTVKLAVLLAVPVPVVSLLVKPLLVLGLTPIVLLVTTTVTVQVPTTGIVIPVKLKAVFPAVNELPEAPVQVPPAAPVAKMLIFVSVSVNAAPVSAVKALALFSVKVTVEVPPDVIVKGANALAMVGLANTVRLAVLLTAPAPTVWLVVTPLVVFTLTPSVLLVTTTVTVQLPAAGIVNPVKVSAVAPAVNELPEAPVQVPPAAPAAEILIFVSVSVKPAAVNAWPALVLLSVNVTVDVPPVVMTAGAKDFAITG
jgi:hypothetical protein